MTDELTTPVPALGSPLRLVETGLPGEFLVRRQDTSDSLAAAVIRTESEGVFAYPHQAPYTRLGPFRSASEALTACRSAFSNSGDRPGEAGGA